MKIILNNNSLLKALRPFNDIGFVPTMGSIHEGHLSLIERSNRTCKKTIVSIFVNPKQFNNKKDLKKYPTNIKEDIKILKKTKKVDFLYIPKFKDIYNHNKKSNIKIANKDKILCAKYRKGHFEGVATIILKFLLLIKPEQIYLGEKDFQQILVIKKIIKDFNFDVKVKTIPTIRGPGGIALSSRNQRIKNINNLKKIYDCLCKIKKKIDKDNFYMKDLEYFKDDLIKTGVCKVNYLEILRESDLAELSSVPSKCRIFISCDIQGVNVIDNLSLNKLYFTEGGRLITSS